MRCGRLDSNDLGNGTDREFCGFDAVTVGVV